MWCLSPRTSFVCLPTTHLLNEDPVPPDDSSRIRNLGILAHVDAGKTTVTENLLYLSGAIRSPGNVDKGTSLSDALDVERRRGISVRASAMSFEWAGVRINLIDTPGHVDFSAEVERSLRVLDCAVLVLSAVEGIQAQTESIWAALETLNIPVILFVNKLDRIGADTAKVVDNLKRRFSPDVIPVNQPDKEGESDASIAEFDPDGQTALTESIAAKDDALLERFLNEEPISRAEIEKVIAACTAKRELFPVLCGVAKNMIGTEELLGRIVAWFPDANTDASRPPSGVVFKLDHDPKLGRIAGVRLYTGRLQNRDVIRNVTADRDEKITQIKKSYLNRYEDTGALSAGDIGFFCGMPEVKIGDILGDPGPVPGSCELGDPLLSVQAIPEDLADHARLAGALQQLSSEDPHLNFTWYEDERELHVKIMGPVQAEILKEMLSARFGIKARFSDPTVIYKETPASVGYGIERYTMPKPCWAIVRYRIEPGERGSGVIYSSQVGVNDIKARFQKEIDRSIEGALRQGIKGWEVTDLKIILVEGSDHVLHSRAGNFKLATNIAVLKGLTETGSILLEPILAFKISVAETYVGRITSDIINARGTFDPVVADGGALSVTGRVPLATSMDFPIRLNSLTGGTAKFLFKYGGYEPCPPGEGVVRPYKGISPLDRAKYILKMRGAVTEAV
ncbi:MAG: TetM/TetW/TetO/TetS family tetracycline resistance ribosomal protection protein [Candidatus Latescibacteria bacterium]|nr:TetM/TetW/TetO/TetS family tetracycline resistance ribosomal protection protein [Candidatus Latescibacterota bacterium]